MKVIKDQEDKFHTRVKLNSSWFNISEGMLTLNHNPFFRDKLTQNETPEPVFKFLRWQLHYDLMNKDEYKKKYFVAND